MAYAYVRFVDDGKTWITSVTNIRKFNPQNFDKSATYKVFYDEDPDGEWGPFKAQVILVGETRDEVIKLSEKKRISFHPVKFMDHMDDATSSNSELEAADAEVAEQKKKKKKTQKEATRLHKEIINANFKRVLDATNVSAERPSIKSKSNKDQDLHDDRDSNYEMQEEIKILRKENSELRSLNIRLQKVLIEKLEKLDLTEVEKHQQNEEKRLPDVGEKVGKEIHLGRGVFLPECTYNLIAGRPPAKDGLFIKEIASAVYGDHILANSSVKGLKCNKIPNAEPKPALDGTKKLAIMDILTHRLKARNEGPEEIKKILGTVNQKLSEKIQDLNRNKKSIPKNNLPPSETNEKPQDENYNLMEEVEEAEKLLELN